MKSTALLFALCLLLPLYGQEEDSYSRAISLQYEAQQITNLSVKNDYLLEAISLFQKSDADKKASLQLTALKPQVPFFLSRQKIRFDLLTCQQLLNEEKDELSLQAYKKFQRTLNHALTSIEQLRAIALFEGELYYTLSLRSQPHLKNQAIISNQKALGKTQNTNLQNHIQTRIAELKLFSSQKLETKPFPVNSPEFSYISFLEQDQQGQWLTAQQTLEASLSSWKTINSPKRDVLIAASIIRFSDLKKAQEALEVCLKWPQESNIYQRAQLTVLAKHKKFTQFQDLLTSAKNLKPAEIRQHYGFAAHQAMMAQKEEQAFLFFGFALKDAQAKSFSEKTYFLYAELLEKRQAYPKAIKIWQERLKLASQARKKAFALRQISRLQKKMQQFIQAENSLEQAIKLADKQESLQAKLELFYLYLEQKKLPEVLKLGKTLTPLLKDSKRDLVLSTMIDILHQKKDFAECLKLLLQSDFKGLQPEQRFLAYQRRFHLAIILRADKKILVDSVSEMSSFTQRPQIKQLHNTQRQLAQYLFHQQDYSEARKLCLRLLEKDQQKNSATFLLAQIYEKEKDFTRALLAYRKILQEDNAQAWYKLSIKNCIAIAKKDSSLLSKVSFTLSQQLQKNAFRDLELQDALDLEDLLIQQKIDSRNFSLTLDQAQKNLQASEIQLIVATREFRHALSLAPAEQITSLSKLLETLPQQKSLAQKIILQLATIEEEAEKKISHYQHFLYLQVFSKQAIYHEEQSFKVAKKLLTLLIAEKDEVKFKRWSTRLKARLHPKIFSQLPQLTESETP